MITRRKFIATTGAVVGAAAATGLFAERASATASTLTIALANQTTSSTVYAYITGQAIDNGNALFLLQADGHTPYYPSSPGSTGSALRKAEGLRVRLPLTRLTVVADDAAALAPYVDLVRDELNVRSVDLAAASDEGAASFGVRQVLQVNARAAGPRLGRDVQLAIKGAKSGDWSVDDAGVVTSGGFALVEGEYTLETVAGSADESAAVGVLPGGGFVVLDTAVTPELAAEGLARDLVRAVQQARRDAGLDVSDRITLTVAGPEGVLAAARTHEELLASETLATSVVYEESGETSVAVARA